MSRCKGCDIILLSIRNNSNGVLEDLCTRCRSLSRERYAYTLDHEFFLGDAREGLSAPKSVDYDGSD